MTWSLELTHPLRLLGLFGAAVLFYYFYCSLTDFPKWQKRTSLATRTVILLLLVLALAGLTLSRPTSEQFVIFAVDQSLSVGQESQQEARKFLDEATAKAGRTRVAFLPFEGEPGKLAEKHPPLFEKTELGSKPIADAPPPATNVEAALEAAVAMIPPGYVPQVVLLSDGNQTRGDSLRTSLRAGHSPFPPFRCRPAKKWRPKDSRLSGFPPRSGRGSRFLSKSSSTRTTTTRA